MNLLLVSADGSYVKVIVKFQAFSLLDETPTLVKGPLSGIEGTSSFALNGSGFLLSSRSEGYSRNIKFLIWLSVIGISLF